MVKPENIEPSLPEVDPITNDQEAQIDDFLQHVEKAFPDGLPLLLTREESTERQRMLAYRFLKARKWKLADALTMFMKTVAYRKEMQIDSWRLFPCAFPILGYDITKLMELADRIAPNPTKYPRSTSESFDACYRALQASYVNLYHFWDKEGHPVLYDGFGKTHAKQVIRDLKAATPPGKSLKDIVLPYHVYMNEVQYYLIRHADELSRSQGRRAITGITVILDAQGLHFGLLNRQFIDVVRKIFAVDQDYYPEVLHRLFVINAPYLLTVAYNRVKGSLDVHTRNKVVFCGEKETSAVLQRVIDFDHLPMELGGHCNCPGGCLPRYIRPDISGPDDSMDEARTEEFTIKAGKKVHKPFPIEAGMEFSWEFAMSSEDTDIRFSIIFDAEGKGATALQVKADKSDADDGSYLAPSKGIVTITFDNSSSWISAKTVLLRAGVGSPSSDDIQTAVS